MIKWKDADLPHERSPDQIFLVLSHGVKQQDTSFSEMGRTYNEFREFRESHKSLKHELQSI